MKILNLYAGIGGNRKLWENVEVTAVELDLHIASIYKSLYPADTIVVDNAHNYLIEHFEEFDFIWSSPPCPTHSVTNCFLHHQGVRRYPDFTLWQEIVFLKKWFKGKFVVENVKSYYPPLWPPIEIDRHYFWSNFYISDFKVERNFNVANARASTRNAKHDEDLENFHKIYLPKEIKNRRIMLRNCVYPPLGLHILNESKKNIQAELFK